MGWWLMDEPQKAALAAVTSLASRKKPLLGALISKIQLQNKSQETLLHEPAVPAFFCLGLDLAVADVGVQCLLEVPNYVNRNGHL